MKNSDNIMKLSMARFCVILNFIMCCKASWAGMIFCCDLRQNTSIVFGLIYDPLALLFIYNQILCCDMSYLRGFSPIRNTDWVYSHEYRTQVGIRSNCCIIRDIVMWDLYLRKDKY